MNFRVIIWGVGLQLLIALFVFVIPVGEQAFLAMNDAVVKVLDSASAATCFILSRSYLEFPYQMPELFPKLSVSVSL